MIHRNTKREKKQTMKKALIVRISGKDGSYLVEFLLSKDYEVHGLIRRATLFNTYLKVFFYNRYLI